MNGTQADDSILRKSPAVSEAPTNAIQSKSFEFPPVLLAIARPTPAATATPPAISKPVEAPPLPPCAVVPPAAAPPAVDPPAPAIACASVTVAPPKRMMNAMSRLSKPGGTGS